ncbi:N-acetylmuramoyl-L-alanine amidase [Nonlabens sp. Hel1_33_55]|uniref:N-acetylmuramoyl-L-alanine amidase family protein n=1 Tax=Nonlabens sp. Hel1_33_55 TaxID=1336802 RepID=UPI000875C21C|nr:N-acetylmuramoyl-L-alanine amidase [Nonlabens sp. Hel1_33_55]SCY11594.1 N-acetylmuramoyl-L-alanine amidase [Nonlabens sp. Hel1_33_55]
MKTKIYLFIALLTAPLVLFASAINSLETDPPNRKFKVVLDAGHGGKDPGYTHAGVNEKDVALKVMLAIGKKLEQHSDIEVLYTRKSDVFIELADRAKVANKADADLFVSIHCNGFHKEQANGNETWVLGLRRSTENLDVVMKENSVILLEDNYEENYNGFDPNDPSSYATSVLTQEINMEDSIDLAAQIQNNFASKVRRTNRGVKQNVFLVLRETYMPSVLVELGFITNNSERKYLTSGDGQQSVAESIYDGIMSYKQNRDINISDVSDGSSSTSAVAVDPIPSNSSAVYKVQIAASSKSLAPKSNNFKKLPSISKEKEGDIYRYFTGETSSLKKASELREQAISKGYKTAFIVIIENGTRRRL